MNESTPRHLPVSLIPKELQNYEPGDYAFDGSCIPGTRGAIHWQETFSVGVFQWELKSGSKSKLKRGKVIKRFSGPVRNPDAVYSVAHEYVLKLMAREGEHDGD